VSTAVKLTPTSAIVLGFLELVGEATPYDLKRYAARSVGHFWTFQHAQLYTETERLAKAGLLREEREEGGRRRKHYSLTEAGRKALAGWRSQPTTELAELRDLGVLQLFFGADPPALGASQSEAHERKLAEYLDIRARSGDDVPEGPRHALECGIEVERALIRFWKQLADSGA
jgi:DNA-binding PadR family transcriptional regulator